MQLLWVITLTGVDVSLMKLCCYSFPSGWPSSAWLDMAHHHVPWIHVLLKIYMRVQCAIMSACTCTWMSVRVYRFACGCMCVQAHVEASSWHWCLPWSLFFHLICWGRVSYLTLELIDLAGLDRQLALGTTGAGITGRLPSPPSIDMDAGGLNSSLHAYTACISPLIHFSSP